MQNDLILEYCLYNYFNNIYNSLSLENSKSKQKNRVKENLWFELPKNESMHDFEDEIEKEQYEQQLQNALEKLKSNDSDKLKASDFVIYLFCLLNQIYSYL